MIKITAYKYHGVILTYSIDTKVFTERFLTCLILSYAPPWRIWSASLLKKIASLYSFSIPKKQNMKVWFSPLMVSESVNTLKSVKWVCDISQLITCKSQWASLIIITKLPSSFYPTRVNNQDKNKSNKQSNSNRNDLPCFPLFLLHALNCCT